MLRVVEELEKAVVCAAEDPGRSPFSGFLNQWDGRPLPVPLLFPTSPPAELQSQPEGCATQQAPQTVQRVTSQGLV